MTTKRTAKKTTQSQDTLNESSEVPATAPIDSTKHEDHHNYGNRRLIVFDELPEWMKDNHWIQTGYRIPLHSYRKCLQSLFYLHNEWVNVWSHLLGAIAFILFFFTTYFTVLRNYVTTLSWPDIVVWYCFLSGGVICLGLSALFHCFVCHSKTVAATWNRCDYVGIVCLIVGSFYPSIYYGFYCKRTFQIAYIVGITVLGALTITVAVMKHFRTPEYRWMRTVLFLSLGLSAIIPVAHGILIYGLKPMFDIMSFQYMVAMGSMYVSGALIYGFRIPERWWPGYFDIWGSSHQIFHMLVVGAALVHYLGVMKAMKFWHEGGSDIICANNLN